jgi:hypothetical protein
MHAKVTIMTVLPRAAVEERLANLTSGGPFRPRDLTPLEGGSWAFTLQPLRPGLSVGFAKVAELLVLLAREFHIETVERIANGTLNASPSVSSSDAHADASLTDCG